MHALCSHLLPVAALVLALTLPRPHAPVELEPARMASPGRGGLPRVVVTHHSGAQLEVYLHGATITSFRTPAGQELLFTSTEAVFDGE
jgi:glucose-6-phosphate 1-epimerase